MNRRPPNTRRGFVLLATLWVMVGVAALGLGVTLAGRRGLRSARNRQALVVAQWRTEACIAEARALIDAALASAANEQGTGAGAWGTLDVVALPVLGRGRTTCAVSFRAAGARLDLNKVDGSMFHRLLAGLTIPAPRADSLTDALLDWRDPDDVPRPCGAERQWYVQHERRTPRNAPLADLRELARVRGFDGVREIDSLVDVEPARVDWNHAPLLVLASLPGVGDEALAHLAEVRARGDRITDLSRFAATLSTVGRTAMLARYADLSRLATTEPDAWLLVARARAGSPAITAALELRLVRAGTRAAVVRRRTWVE